mgnify:CR=1 FL=1|jgi:hypothetical protein
MSGVEHEYRRYMVSGQTIKIRTSSMLVPNTDTMRERYRLFKGLAAGTYKTNHAKAHEALMYYHLDCKSKQASKQHSRHHILKYVSERVRFLSKCLCIQSCSE